jgi:PAS domain S-box-containing protein
LQGWIIPANVSGGFFIYMGVLMFRKSEWIWDPFINLLSRQETSLEETFKGFSTLMLQLLGKPCCALFVSDRSGQVLRQLTASGLSGHFSWDNFQHPSGGGVSWNVVNNGTGFLRHISADVKSGNLFLTNNSLGQRNGILFIGDNNSDTSELNEDIDPFFSSLVRHRFGTLINSSLKLEAHGPSKESYISQTLEATNDSYIIYDKSDRVVAFSPNQIDYYPWLESHLFVGAKFENLVRVVAHSGTVRNIEGEEDSWLKKRLKMRNNEFSVMDMDLADGRVMRLRDSNLPNGGWVAMLTEITGFKRHEEEILEREAQYRNLLEVGTDAICIMLDGELAFVNKRMVNLFNADDATELLSRPYKEFVHPDDFEKLENISSNASDSLVNCRMQRNDGSIFHAEITQGPVIWQRQSATLYTIRDTTSSRRLLKKLRNREKMLVDAHKLLKGGHWRFDMSTGLIEISEELKLVLKWNTPTVGSANERLANMYPPGIEEELMQVFRDAIKSKTPFDFEHPIKIEGEDRVIQAVGETSYDNSGRATQIFGISRDITEDKNLENALRRNEQRLRDLNKASADMYWETDSKNMFTYVSEDVVSLVGRNSKGYLGQTVRQIFDEDELAEPRISALVEYVETQTAFRDHIFPRRHINSQKLVWVRASAAPFFDENSNFCGFRGCNTDVTKQVELEQQLVQSQKMEAIGHLSSGIAHDFNNLLAVIQGNTELLIEDLPNDSTAQCQPKLSNILEAAQRGADLTYRMLAYSRKQTLRPSSFNLNAQLTNMVGMLGRTLGEEYDIKLNLEPGIWAVYADSNQVDNVFLNLSLNARDAMVGGGSIQVTTQNITITANQEDAGKLKAGQYVALSVQDSGCGIPTEILNNVFDPFFTTKEVGKGTGLGLSVVMGFARQSDGTVNITSEEGRGTKVCVYLPAHLTKNGSDD